MSNSRRFNLSCPDCGAAMVVDAATGDVISHRSVAKSKPAKDFDQLLAGLGDDKARASEIFDQGFAALEDRERVLDEKFDEALKRAKSDGEPAKQPPRPWDLD